MRLDIFCMSDTGCVRSGNQDMAAAGLNLIRDGQTGFTRTIGEADNFLLLVADGMGGHQHGEMASSYALEELRAVILDRDRDWSDPGRLLTEEALRISTELNLKSTGMQLEKPMGCTLTGFVWAGGRTLLVNVGDSRSYRLRGGMLRRLTQDQTLHERDMVPLPAGKAIYSCLGGGISPETVIQDYGDRLLPGDRLLICSDGLTDMVGENDIEVFLAEGQPAQAGSLLVESAKAAGGFDNISVIVADILGDDPGTEETEPLAAAEESIQVFPGNAAGPAEDGALHEVTGPGESSEDMSEGDAPGAGGESE